MFAIYFIFLNISLIFTLFLKFFLKKINYGIILDSFKGYNIVLKDFSPFNTEISNNLMNKIFSLDIYNKKKVKIRRNFKKLYDEIDNFSIYFEKISFFNDLIVEGFIIICLLALFNIIFNNFFYKFSKINSNIIEKHVITFNLIILSYLISNYNKINNCYNLNFYYFYKNFNNLENTNINLYKFENIQHLERKFKTIKVYLLNTKNNFLNRTSNWKIKFLNTSNVSLIDIFSIKKYCVYYLRKNKIFNKGRYSRSRQIYRTGVYWSIYVNIIVMAGLFFWFYRFSINFGYLWWFFFIFLLSFFLPKAINYNIYLPFNIIISFILDLKWISTNFIVLLKYTINLIISIFDK